MKCDLCNKPASVFLTQIVKDQVVNVNLCESCSKEKGVTDTTGFGLAEAFIGPVSARGDELACPACGFTQSQLKKIGRMGCPECYTTFRDGLEGLLSSMHKGTVHIGKKPHHGAATAVSAPPKQAVVPTRRESPTLLKKTLAGLRDHLNTAVAEERFEDAARLKKEIVILEKKLADLE